MDEDVDGDADVDAGVFAVCLPTSMEHAVQMRHRPLRRRASPPWPPTAHRPPPPHPLPLAYGWAPAARPSSRASLAVVACRTDHPRCQLAAVWLRVQAPTFACFCMTELVPSKRKKKGGHVHSLAWPFLLNAVATTKSLSSHMALC